MYKDLIAHPGQMYAFHINLALKPFSHHSSFWAAIPFFVLVLLAVGLQYIQMTQMNRRNPAAAQANPQMQTMQKFMPIVMAYIYFLIPAAVVIYMVVSTGIRILTQDIMFRTGMVQSPGATVIAPSSSAGGATKKTGPAERVIPASGKPSNGTGAKKAPASTNGAGAKSGRQPAAKNGQSESEAAVPPEAKAHPRSRDKRARRAR
jgi:YidC/Oxa1 family membrane protein insertase